MNDPVKLEYYITLGMKDLPGTTPSLLGQIVKKMKFCDFLPVLAQVDVDEHPALWRPGS
jgi:hypothetical protein